VEGHCECGNVPSSFINAEKLLSGCRAGDVSSSAQMHSVRQLYVWIRFTSMRRYYMNTINEFRDIIHALILFKTSVSVTGFCFCLQLKV
jgi:hypothetical protein